MTCHTEPGESCRSTGPARSGASVILPSPNHNAGHATVLRSRIACVVLLAVAWIPGRPAHGSSFSGTVVSVADGDTITVRVGSRTEKVRLHGVDCPERHQAFGTRARRTTSELTAGRQVRVDVVGRDEYGRVLGDVFLTDGRSLNQELVRRGLAWWYRHYSSDAMLARLEADARAARRGLWADPNPTPPWEFRRRERAPRTGQPPRGP